MPVAVAHSIYTLFQSKHWRKSYISANIEAVTHLASSGTVTMTS